MIKIIIFVLLALIVIGSSVGNVFSFASQVDIWTITINHSEFINGVIDGFDIAYTFIMDFISNDSVGVNETQANTQK